MAAAMTMLTRTRQITNEEYQSVGEADLDDLDEVRMRLVVTSAPSKTSQAVEENSKRLAPLAGSTWTTRRTRWTRRIRVSKVIWMR